MTEPWDEKDDGDIAIPAKISFNFEKNKMFSLQCPCDKRLKLTASVNAETIACEECGIFIHNPYHSIRESMLGQEGCDTCGGTGLVLYPLATSFNAQPSVLACVCRDGGSLISEHIPTVQALGVVLPDMSFHERRMKVLTCYEQIQKNKMDER